MRSLPFELPPYVVQRLMIAVARQDLTSQELLHELRTVMAEGGYRLLRLQKWGDNFQLSCTPCWGLCLSRRGELLEIWGQPPPPRPTLSRAQIGVLARLLKEAEAAGSWSETLAKLHFDVRCIGARRRDPGTVYLRVQVRGQPIMYELVYHPRWAVILAWAHVR